MPFLRYIIPGPIGYTEMMEIHDNLYEFIRVSWYLSFVAGQTFKNSYILIYRQID